MINEKLLMLLEENRLDWENEHHREMFLKTWVMHREELPRYEIPEKKEQ